MILAETSVFTSAASVAGVVVAIIALAGVLAVAFRNQRNATVLANAEAIADSWKERAEALEERNKTRDEAIKDLQVKLLEKDHEIHTLQGTVSTLQDMVTGKSAIEELAIAFEQRNIVMNERVSEALNQINAVRTDLRSNYSILLELQKTISPTRRRSSGDGGTTRRKRPDTGRGEAGKPSGGPE